MLIVIVIVYALISIHALLAESDSSMDDLEPSTTHFYPRSPCGERPLGGLWVLLTLIFLSTLSLRRATDPEANSLAARQISIHALLAESDPKPSERHASSQQFLSTLSLRRATYQQTAYFFWTGISIHALLAESDASSQSSAKSTPEISIHALLAESDGHDPSGGRICQGFLSTLSLRRATA